MSKIYIEGKIQFPIKCEMTFRQKSHMMDVCMIEKLIVILIYYISFNGLKVIKNINSREEQNNIKNQE